MTIMQERPTAPTDLFAGSTLSGFEPLAVSIGLRRVITSSEEIPRANAEPITRATATAVIANPWVGTSTAEDLASESERIAPILAKILTDRLIEVLGGAAEVEAFGKAALVGTAGEIEHGGALIHTPFFGNIMREALEGSSILCFVDGRADAGELLRVPLWHKNAAATRTHYQTLEVQLSDAPNAGEIAIIAAASTGPRPFARIGDRTTDKPVTSEILKEIQL